MLPTSGSFNFQSVPIKTFVEQAFQWIEIPPEQIDVEKQAFAKSSIDFLLSSWMVESTNLWTLSQTYLPLLPAQRQYILPNTISDVIQAVLRQSTRQLNGVAASSAGGVADNAFDGNSTTACTQNAPDGNISYDYGIGKTQAISFVGIQSNSNTSYSLVVESSQDTVVWETIGTITQSFVAGVNVWIDILRPATARAYRIRETGGATLDIQEIYFNNQVIDYEISEISRSQYLSFPNKSLQGRPTSYYLDRQLSPTLYIWPVPTAIYNCLQISYKQMIQDVGKFSTNTVFIPGRFYSALVFGLAWYLAIRYKFEKAQYFQALYKESFAIATIEDSETTPIRILPDDNYSYGE